MSAKKQEAKRLKEKTQAKERAAAAGINLKENELHLIIR
jgi:hypothetical protein